MLLAPFPLKPQEITDSPHDSSVKQHDVGNDSMITHIIYTLLLQKQSHVDYYCWPTLSSYQCFVPVNQDFTPTKIT